MATPSPIPVLPSLSLSLRMSASPAPSISGRITATLAASSSSTWSLVVAASSGIIPSGWIKPSIFINSSRINPLPKPPGPMLSKRSAFVGFDQPVVAILAAIDDIEAFRYGIGKNQEFLVQQIHLHDRFLNRHRLYVKGLGPDHNRSLPMLD